MYSTYSRRWGGDDLKSLENRRKTHLSQHNKQNSPQKDGSSNHWLVEKVLLLIHPVLGLASQQQDLGITPVGWSETVINLS